MLPLLLATLLTSVATPAPTAAPAMPAPPVADTGRGPYGAIRAFERSIAADVAADSVGSIAAAVVVDGQIVWQGAFGWTDRGSGQLATSRTVYRTGSISKTITALVLMRLVAQGVVGLDEPVVRYVPELRRLANRAPDHRAITFRDLASHTAGLAREPGLSHAARGAFRQWKRRLVDVIPATEVVSPPGEEYRYSNIGYGILGFALERAAGRPFEVLVQELVFDPLGMDDSRLLVPRSERGAVAAGYVNVSADSVDPRVPRAEHRGRGYKVPNGGIYSTVGDLGRLLIGFVGGRAGENASSGDARALLSDRLRSVMLEDHAPGDAAYGLGLQLLPIGQGVLAGHSGSVAGYSGFLLFDPATAYGVVLLRNYNRGETNLGAAATRLLLELREGG